MLRGITAVVVVGVLLTGCGGGSETVASSSSSSSDQAITATTTVSANQKVADWGVDVLSPSLDRLSDAFTWAGGAMQSLDVSDARAACRELDSAVDELEGKLPAPSVELTSAVTASVENLRGYARICQGLSPSTSKSDFAEMQAYQDQGLADMGRATDIVKAAQKASG